MKELWTIISTKRKLSEASYDAISNLFVELTNVHIKDSVPRYINGECL